MKRTIFALGLLALPLLGLTGCGHEHGLTVRGTAEVRTGEAVTGFDFPQEVRLDTADASVAGRVTGECELRRVPSEVEGDQYAVVVTVLRGGMVDDQGLSSLTLLQRTDALPENGRVELELGTTPFASREGECRLDIDYLVEDSGMLGLSGGCETYDQAGRAASVSVGLDLVGCTVAR